MSKPGYPRSPDLCIECGPLPHESWCAIGMGEEITALRDVLSDLVARDDDPCYFDHHGYCQAHNWLQEGECPHARAKRLLATEA